MKKKFTFHTFTIDLRVSANFLYFLNGVGLKVKWVSAVLFVSKTGLNYVIF